MQRSTMLVVAHRGAHQRNEIPENSLLAFQKALEQKCDGLELDVHLTKDSQIVVIHDSKLDRTTNGIGFVEDFTLEELKKLTLKNAVKEVTSKRIPTLNEVLLLVRGQCKVLVELKSKVTNMGLSMILYSRLPQLLFEELRLHDNWVEWVWVQSFHDMYLQECRRLHSSVVLHKLVGFFRDVPVFGPVFLDLDGLHNSPLLKNESIQQCQITSVNVHHTSVTPALLEYCHAEKITVFAWTVDDAALTKRLLDMKVDGIITNFPKLVRGAILE